jgi:hypothetical protein
MNTENYPESNPHRFKNYLIGSIAVLLVLLIPILNLVEKKPSNSSVGKIEKSENVNTTSGISGTDNTEKSSLSIENPVITNKEQPYQARMGEESIDILNKPPPEGVTLPRKICMVTSVAMSWKGILANMYTNIATENCDVEAFNSMSIASATAQVASLTNGFQATKTGPYFSTATKDLTVSNKGFVYLGSQKFVSTISIDIGWTDILMNPQFLLGSSVVRRAQYFPLPAAQNINLFWSPGEPAYVLINPRGETFIMTHYSIKLLPGLNRYNLLSLNKLLILPNDWKFVKAEIIKPIWLTHGADDGYSSIITYDNLGNIYVKADLKKTVALDNAIE